MEILEAHRGIVLKVAHAYCRDLADRQDLIQTIVVELWRAYPRFDRKRRFSTWLYRIAVNVAISFHRRQSRHVHEVMSLDDPAFEQRAVAMREPAVDDQHDALYDLIASLDALHRALILLYLDGHSYAEIADVLGISETNVATKIGRIKQKFRTNPTGTEAPLIGDPRGTR